MKIYCAGKTDAEFGSSAKNYWGLNIPTNKENSPKYLTRFREKLCSKTCCRKHVVNNTKKQMFTKSSRKIAKTFFWICFQFCSNLLNRSCKQNMLHHSTTLKLKTFKFRTATKQTTNLNDRLKR